MVYRFLSCHFFFLLYFILLSDIIQNRLIVIVFFLSFMSLKRKIKKYDCEKTQKTLPVITVSQSWLERLALTH